MKKLLLIPFLMLFLVSCSEDDPATPVNESQLTTWKIFEVKINGTVDPFGPCNGNNTMTLKADGTGVLQGYYQNDAQICASSDPVNFTYEIDELLGTFTIDYMQNGNHYHFVEDILMYNGQYFSIDATERMDGVNSVFTYIKVQ